MRAALLLLSLAAPALAQEDAELLLAAPRGALPADLVRLPAADAAVLPEPRPAAEKAPALAPLEKPSAKDRLREEDVREALRAPVPAVAKGRAAGQGLRPSAPKGRKEGGAR